MADLSVGVQSAARGAVCSVSQVRLEFFGECLEHICGRQGLTWRVLRRSNHLQDH